MDNINSYIVLSVNTTDPIIIPNNISSYASNRTEDENIVQEYIPSVQQHVKFLVDSTEICSPTKNQILMQNNAAIKCTNCDESFVDVPQYENHKKTHEHDSLLECSICKETFTKLSSYKKHFLSHEDNDLFICSLCNLGFNIENNYKIHMVLHGNSLVCPICELSFQRKAGLKGHLAIHQVEELYRCPECASEFATKVDLRKHIEIHAKESKENFQKLICKYCKVKFDSLESLKQHVTCHSKLNKIVLTKKAKKEQHTAKSNKHRCNVCDKSFAKFSLLKRHARIHNGERPFVCPRCFKGFSQKVSLQIHSLKHSGIKPFCCTLCPSKFYQKCNLKVHVQKTHTANGEGDKNFKCSECNCIFKKLASLNAHMRKTHADCDLVNITTVIDQLKHLEKQLDGNPADKEKNEATKKSEESGDLQLEDTKEGSTNTNCQVYSLMQKFNGSNKVYVCSFCSKEAKKPSDIIRHIRTHTKEKPYKCHCGSSFALKATLLSHMKKHTEEKCNKCSKIITSPKQWKAHLRKHMQVEHIEPKKKEQKVSDGAKDVDLERNVQLPRVVKRFKCSLCSESFHSFDVLKNHMSCHLDTGDAGCDVNEKDENTEFYECPYCREKFENLISCNKHMVSHEIQESEKLESDVRSSQRDMSIENLLRTHPNTVIYDESLNLQTIKEVVTESVEPSLNISDIQKVIPSLPVITSAQNEDLQTILVSYPGDNQENLLANYILSGPNNFVLDPICEKNEEAPIILNVQTINVADENIMNKQNAKNSKKISREPNFSVINQNIGPSIESLDNCGTNDIGDSFLSHNDSLYPNLQNNLATIPEINCNSMKITESERVLNEFNNSNVENSLKLPEVGNEIQENFGLSMILCLVCKEIFENLEPYLNHMKTCSSNTDEELEEKMIEKADQKKNSILKVNEKPVKKTINLYCVHCEKEFSNRGIYVKHINSHHKKKNDRHECKYCFKLFKKLSDLGRHLRTHTGEKPFACDQCEKKFSLKSTLESHYRTHDPTATKSFVCEVCNSFFTSKASKKVHMYVHTGTKPHKCRFCDECFRTGAHRKCHEKTKHLGGQIRKVNQKKSKKITNILATAVEMAVNEINKDNEQLKQNKGSVYPEMKVEFSGSKSGNITIDPRLLEVQSSNMILQGMGQEIPSCSQSNYELASSIINSVNEAPDFTKNHTVDDFFSIIDEKPDALHESTQLELRKCSQCNLCFFSNEDLSNHEKSHSSGQSYSSFLCDINLGGVE